MTLLEIFCDVDDCCQQFVQQQTRQLPAQAGRQVHQPGLCESEIMTSLIHLHQAGYRHFKTYYTDYVHCHLQAEFPGLVSYSRFVSLIPRVVLMLWAYLLSRCGHCIGLFLYRLQIYHNWCIRRNRVFAGCAARGKSSMG